MGKIQLIFRFQMDDFRQNECPERLFLQKIKSPSELPRKGNHLQPIRNQSLILQIRYSLSA